MEAFQATVFVPDEKIIFPNKESLKHKHSRIVPIKIQYIFNYGCSRGIDAIFYDEGN